MNQDNIKEILCKILMLQKQDFDADLSGCDRPFLGPSPASTTYNTRPIEFYNSYTGELWEFPYTTGTTTTTSSTFRVESLEDNTVTVRLLQDDGAIPRAYTNTNQYVTIRLSTIGAIQCLPDTFVTL